MQLRSAIYFRNGGGGDDKDLRCVGLGGRVKFSSDGLVSRSRNWKLGRRERVQYICRGVERVVTQVIAQTISDHVILVNLI